MIDVEPLIRRDLDLLVELPEDLQPDWEDVRRRGVNAWALPTELAPRLSLLQRLRKRPLLVVALVLLIAFVPVSALAVAGKNPWWFLRASTMFGNGPAKGSVVVVLKRGSWDGQGWVLTAYKGTRGLCYQLTQTSAHGKATNLGAGGCGSAPGTFARAGIGHPVKIAVSWMGSTISIGGPLKGQIRYIVGPIVPSASEVVITLANGTVIRTPTFTVPSKLGVTTRFFAAQTSIAPSPNHGALSCRASVLGDRQSSPVRVVGLDASGHVVAEDVVPGNPQRRLPGACEPHRNHFILPPKLPALARVLKPVETVTGPYGGKARVSVGSVFAMTTYRNFHATAHNRVIQPARCWRINFSDGESQGTCIPLTKRYEPENYLGIQHVGRDTFVILQAEPRTGPQIARLDLQLANGHVLTATPIDGIVVFAIPANALSTTKSQRGFTTGYTASGKEVAYYNAFGQVQYKRQPVYYRSCPPGGSCS